MIVTMFSTTTVFVWGNEDFSKKTTESVDIRDYLEQYSQLVSLLDMQPVSLRNRHSQGNHILVYFQKCAKNFVTLDGAASGKA